MEIFYKVQIFAIFALPAIVSIGLAEGIKEISGFGKIVLYIFGAISALGALVVPWLK